MSRRLFVLPSVGAGDKVLIASNTGGTPAEIVPNGSGGPVAGSILQAAGDGSLPRVLGPDNGTSTLYLLRLDYRGTITGSPTTLTGVDPTASTALATSPDVAAAVAALVNGAPADRDTLGEVGALLSALPGTYVSQQAADPSQQFGSVPAHAGARTGPYDTANHIYNLNRATARRIRAKVASANAGQSRCKVLMMGHSHIAGVGSTIGSTDMPTTLRKLLKTNGHAVRSTGFVFTYDYTGVADTRWNLAAGSANNGTAAIPHLWVNYAASGKASTFSSDVKGRIVDILHIGAYSGGWTYSIDGGAPVTVTPAGNSVQIISVDTGVYGLHNVVITTNSSGTTYQVAVRTRDTAGLEVTKAGSSGSTVASWLPTSESSVAYNAFGLATADVPDITFVELDANEALQGVSAATYKTNLTALVNALQALSPQMDICLIHAPSMVPGGNGFSAVSQAAWDAIGSAMYDVADTFGLPLVDLTDKFGETAASAQAAGLMYDQVHLNAAGYAQVAASAIPVLGS